MTTMCVRLKAKTRPFFSAPQTANAFQCTECGKPFSSIRPQDPRLKAGVGRCFTCRPLLILDLQESGDFLTREQAEHRVAYYA